MSHRDLSDAEWSLLECHLPQGGHRGRPWRNHRDVLNGILWVLRTGAQWREVPERYGPWQTAYDRFNRWSRDGTFERLQRALLDEMHQVELLANDLWAIDSTQVRAGRDAAGAGKKRGPTSPMSRP